MSLTARVDAVIDDALARQTIVGTTILVARDGETVYARAAGFMDREAGRVVVPRTLFRLASVTKPMVSVAALGAVEAGLIRLDDPVTRVLPDFRPRLPDGSAPDITLRHLLTHTAGLTYDLGYAAGVAAPASGGLDGARLTMAENLRRISALPLAFAPGTNWTYSVAIDVVGGLLEAVEGRSLPEIVRARVTGPLGMHDTDFSVRDPARLSVAYADGQPPQPMSEPQIVLAPDGTERQFSPGRAFDTTSFASGGAGMIGSAEDFLVFLEAMRRGGAPVISPQSHALLAHNALGPMPAGEAGRGFSLGWSIVTDPGPSGTPASPGTWAWGGVYGHQWLVDPVERLTILSFSNTAMEGCVGMFPKDIFRAVYGP